MSAAWSAPAPMADPRPHPVLVGADWADRYGVEGDEAMTARQALDRMLAATPSWIPRLLAVRNGLVGLVGLKAGRLVVGEGGFPLLSERPEELVLGLDDRHLDFRLVVTVSETTPGRRRIAVATLVRRHNLGGRAYLAAILPFHRTIVRRMLSGL